MAPDASPLMAAYSRGAGHAAQNGFVRTCQITRFQIPDATVSTSHGLNDVSFRPNWGQNRRFSSGPDSLRGNLLLRQSHSDKPPLPLACIGLALCFPCRYHLCDQSADELSAITGMAVHVSIIMLLLPSPASPPPRPHPSPLLLLLLAPPSVGIHPVGKSCVHSVLWCSCSCALATRRAPLPCA